MLTSGVDSPPPGVTDVAPTRTTARWFGPAQRPLLGWLTVPEGRGAVRGIVIAPPLGYPLLTSHRALRVLAETLAADGQAVLRFDYDGTGDSAGDAWDPDRVAAWQASIVAAAEELRAQGCAQVAIVGVRLGANLALLAAPTVGADAVVLWAPAASGKRYAKELRLLGTAIPAEHDRGQGPALTQTGDVYTASTMAAIAALPAPDVRPAPRALLVDDAPGKLAAALTALGTAVDTLPATGSEDVLQTTAERAEVPAAIVAGIRDWLRPSGEEEAAVARPGPAAAAGSEPAATMAWGGGTVRETVLRLGPAGIVGILTEAPEPAAGAATIVFINSGSEPHLGPGRAWVAFARELALRGHRAVRFDFRGWGESPDDGKAPGRPYDDHCLADLQATIAALGALGHPRIVPFGLCVGAYFALLAADEPETAGVIALNAPMMWRPGMPRLLTTEEGIAYRAPERARAERGARLGLWTALDLLGLRDHAGRWLARLARGTAPVTLIYGAGDDGLLHLRIRLARRLSVALRSGRVTLIEIPDIDHTMYRVWRRHEVLDAMDRALRAIAP